MPSAAPPGVESGPFDALSAENAIRHIQGGARYFFEPAQLAALTGHAVGSFALQKSLNRMARAQRICLVTKRPAGWLIIPPEHMSYGAPPVTWWLHDCMQRIDPDYYVALLSAARHWGSAHFALQTTQVMVARPRPPLKPGKLEVQFFTKRALAATPTELVRGDVARWRVSTRESTLLDLIRHQSGVGGIETVFRVAKDFGKALDPTALADALNALDQAPVAQRLGYVFERLGRARLATQVEKWLAGRRSNLHPLELQAPAAEATIEVPRWGIVVGAHRHHELEDLAA